MNPRPGTWRVGIGVLAALSLFAWTFAGAGADDSAEQLNFIALHDRASRQYDPECLSCHASVLTEQSLSPAIHTAHVAMAPFTPGQIGGARQCAVCHRSVDLVQGTQPASRSRTSLRKRVDPALCTLCHGPEGPGLQFYQVGLSSLTSDGATLYDLVCSTCHRTLARSEVRGESASKIQEAIRENKGGMAALRVLSPAQVQAIAEALAQADAASSD